MLSNSEPGLSHQGLVLDVLSIHYPHHPQVSAVREPYPDCIIVQNGTPEDLHYLTTINRTIVLLKLHPELIALASLTVKAPPKLHHMLIQCPPTNSQNSSLC